MYGNHRERMIGSSGNTGHGGSYNFGSGPSGLDPSKQLVQGLAGGSGVKQIVGQQSSLPMTKATKRSNKYLHGTPGQPSHNYQAHFSANGQNLHGHFQRGNSGKLLANQQNGSVSNQSPSLFFNEQAQNTTTLLDMSGNVASLMAADSGNLPLGPTGSHVKQISTLGGANLPLNNFSHATGPPGQFSQNMSDIGLMDNNDVLSMVGKQSQSNYDFQQQTPSQYNNQMDNSHILYSASGYKQSAGARGGHQHIPMSGGAPDLGMLMNNEFDDPSAAAAANSNSFNLGHLGPRGFNPDQLMMMGGQNVNAGALGHQTNMASHQIHLHDGQKSSGQHPSQNSATAGRGSSNNGKRHAAAQRNIQATFYSDGTNMTGTTAATGGGAASQNRGTNQKANVIVMKGSGPPQPPLPPGKFQVDALGKAQPQNTEVDGGERGESAGRDLEVVNAHFQVQMSNSRQGPVKATRAALGN